MNQLTPSRLLAGIFVAVVMLVTGCSSDEPAPAPSASASQEAPATEWTPAAPTEAPESPAPEQQVVRSVATVLPDTITPLDAPEGEPVTELANPMRPGVPLVFLVEEDRGEWLEVQLPIRPNGSTGFVRAADVKVQTLSYALEVSRDDREVVLTQDGEEVATFEAAIGTGDTPTPTGDFFITELLIPTNDGYGPYAFGLSAFSDVLTNFGGGPGQIGLHGTPDADSIGEAASHGCIRLHNEDITYLAELLPLGTPISIS